MIEVSPQSTSEAGNRIEEIYEMPQLKSCPIENTFKIIGKRWTALILRELVRGVIQFNRYRENIPGITPKMLSLRLRELERNGIVKRRIVSKYPVRVEYQLTSLGRELGPLLLQATSFSMRMFPNVVFKDGRSRDPMKSLQNENTTFSSRRRKKNPTKI
jgi:DNA-binding HxlR family transcriptional regulator